MKLQTSLLAVLAALHGAAVAAPIPLTGSITHNENFDSLGAADVAWVDDSTLPGWIAEINNGTTPAGNAQAADGNTVLSGLLNLGAPGAADRALGSKATSTNNFANVAYGIQFQNTSASPVQFLQLTYTGELWRTNTGGIPELSTVFYAVSNTQITDVMSGTTSATATAGTGFIALGAGANWASPANTPADSALDGNDPLNRASVTFTPASSITIAPGQYFMIKWTDTNLANTDGFQGIDDLSIDFSEVSGLLIPTVTAKTRDLAGTPADPADDTFGFTVSVAGSGSVGTGWTTADVSAPNATSATYGTPVVWAGFPLTPAKTANFADNVTPAIAAGISVDPPRIIGTNNIAVAGTPLLDTGASSAVWAIDEVARTSTEANSTTQSDELITSEIINLAGVGFVRFSAELDAIAGTPATTSSGFEAADGFGLELSIDGGAFFSVLGAADTDGNGRLNGAAAAGGLELPDATILAETRNFVFDYIIPEAANSLQIRIIGNCNSPNETLLVKNVTLGAPSATIVATPGLGTSNNKGTVDPADDEFSVPVTINGINLGASTGWTSDEVPPRSGSYTDPQPVVFGPYPGRTPVTVVLRDNLDPNITSGPVTFNPPGATLTATLVANSVTRIAGAGPADDTVTFQINVGATNAGAAFSTAVSLLGTPGPATVSSGGNYPAAGTPVTLTLSNVPTSAGTVPVTITDTSYPAAPAPVTVNVAVPAAALPGIIGQKNFGGLTNVTAGATVPPEWVIYSGPRETIMSAGIAGDSVLDSELIDLTSVGAVSFTAELVARDNSTGSNFESTDRFKAELIVDGDLGNPIPVIPAGIDVGDGAVSTAVNGPPNGFINGYTGTPDEADYNATRDRDEFNTAAADADTQLNNVINLSGSIPAAADNVQLRIVGAGVAGSEALIVRNVLFSTGPVSSDTDGDGVSDADETIMGTSPTDPTDVLRLSQGAANPNVVSFPTKNGRFYKVYSSPDLATWTPTALATFVGNDATQQFDITALITPGTKFFRLHVMETDGPWN